jgi:coenzyme F420-0:L-glutamate ligase / coenzyme F420-1:gamma-L-glutamate ligase
LNGPTERATGVPANLQLIAVPGMPVVKPGDDLADIIVTCLAAAGLALQRHDTVILAQKIVSKAEGRIVDLTSVTPSARAEELAREVAKDPRLVEVILSESRRVVRTAKDVLIVEHRLGFVMANAGVDQSNVAQVNGPGMALMLPRDPDASAARLRRELALRSGCEVAVVINDSFGRPWRLGTVGVAIGSAGLPALRDLRGDPDLFGRPLRVTLVAYADEIAAAASLLMGQADEGRPVVVLRGLVHDEAELPARELIRPPGEDLFR